MDIFKLGDKILSLLEMVFGFWNNQISLVFSMLGQSPVNFKGGGPWAVIEGIEPIFVGVGSSLVVLFFVIGFCSESVDIREEMRFEVILKMLIRVGLARSCGNNPKTEDTDRIIIEGLFTTITNVNFNQETLTEMIAKVRAEKNKIVPDCAVCASRCGNTDEYDMKGIWNANEDIRSLKSLILFGIRGMAAYAYHALVLGYKDEEVNQFFHKALCMISYDLEMTDLLPVVHPHGYFG